MKRAIIPFVFLGTALVFGPSRASDRVTDVQCIASAIYKEASLDSKRGQELVGRTILARMHKGGMSACKVIAKPSAFSWHKKGRGMPSKKLYGPYLPLADSLLAGYHLNGIRGRTPTHFATKATRNKWTRQYVVVAKSDKHIFYKES